MLVASATRNAKTGPVGATYAPTSHCPDSCKLKGNGCYAQGGRVAIVNNRLVKQAKGLSTEQVATLEANALDAAKINPLGLRVHVSGDCRTPKAAKILAAAVRRWRKRGGGPAWSYTHAWRVVEREDWKGVSVLASVETHEQARQALARGYAPARVVASFPNGARAWTQGEVTYVPCPAQTRENVTCASCKLCWRADDLRARTHAIAFKAHSSGAKKVRLALV